MHPNSGSQSLAVHERLRSLVTTMPVDAGVLHDGVQPRFEVGVVLELVAER